MSNPGRKATSLTNSPIKPKEPLFSPLRKRFTYIEPLGNRSFLSMTTPSDKQRRRRIARLSTQLDQICFSATQITDYCRSVSPSRRQARTASLSVRKRTGLNGQELIRGEIVEEYKWQQTKALNLLKTTMPRRFLSPKQQIRLFGNFR